MGKATVYWTPYKGNQVQLWDGANWTTYTSAEISLALGTITAALPYDIFMYQSAGTPTLELLAWTNATTRATAVTLQDGRYAKSGDKTRLYLGSFYTTATTTTEDSKRRRLLWNFYNRVRRDWIARDATTNWAYSLNAYRQARATATNQLEAMVGIAETAVEILSLNVVDTTSNGLVSAGIGINSTTVNSASLFSGLTAVTTATVMTTSQLREVRLGYTFYPWLERGFGTGTQTWYGVFGTSVQTGLVGTLEC
jgi:hypothetical protein